MWCSGFGLPRRGLGVLGESSVAFGAEGPALVRAAANRAAQHIAHQNALTDPGRVYALAYKSGVAWNDTSYSNPEFDALLAEALGTPDVDDRREIMAKLETVLRESGIIIQPYWRSVYRSCREGVHGFEAHQSYEQHLDKVWLES